MTTLRDALTDALGKSEEGTLTAPVETPIETDAPQEQAETQSERDERIRDERGRFAAKSEEQPVEADPAPTRKPPSSWKKDYWGQWDKLASDPELAKLQDYIEQREGDFAKGVSTYKSQWDQAAPIYEAVQPFLPELKQYGIQPGQWIQNLGTAHRTLAMGTPEQKLQMFAKLATDYGVPLQALQGGQDPQAGYVTQTVGQLQQTVQQMLAQQQAQEQARLQNEIKAFQESAPHFEEVKPLMAQLLESGVASDLKTAYDKAVRLNDDVWSKVQAEQASHSQRQTAIAHKKAAAVSPKSSGPTGSMVQGGAKKGLRDVLSEQFDSVSTGRF